VSKEKQKTSTKSRITKLTKKSLQAFDIPLGNGLQPSSPSTGKNLGIRKKCNFETLAKGPVFGPGPFLFSVELSTKFLDSI